MPIVAQVSERTRTFNTHTLKSVLALVPSNCIGLSLADSWSPTLTSLCLTRIFIGSEDLRDGWFGAGVTKDTVQWLINHQANVTCVDELGRTPLLEVWAQQMKSSSGIPSR
eukprot:4662088-Amphidinium_carterae.1